MPSLTAREAVTVPEKPLAEVLVEGELSPFEHEALYRILRKGFRLEHPSYTELTDEDLVTGVLEEKELSSALDQIGHLTGILGQMLRPETMEKPLELVEAQYDRKSDRWHEFKGFGSSDRSESYVFDESVFRWVRS
jgi:hypothetical protein